MSITSANPDDLEHFVDRSSRRRRSLESDLSGLIGQQNAVVAASPDYRVSSNVLAAARQAFAGFELNERFVDTIRTQLLRADRDPNTGVASIPSAVVADALRAAGLTQPPAPVEVEPGMLLGLPPTSGFVDDPICAANGNFVHVENDLLFPGRSAVLDVVRVYNSLGTATVGAFGPGWSSPLDVRVSYVDGGVVRVHLADGAVVPFTELTGGRLAAAGTRPLTIERTDDGGWLLFEGHTKTWQFDADGALLGGSAGAARLHVERDASGRVVGMREVVSGRSVRFEWVDGRVASADASDGRSIYFTYDADGVLVHVDRASGSMTYGVDGPLVVDVVDADGVRLAHNVYDDDGRVVQQTNELGRTTTYQYSEFGTTLVADTNEGPKNAFTHDRRGNLTAVVDGEGRALRLAYDDAGRVVTITDRTGAVTRQEYDGRGNLAARIDPDGLSTRWEWDELDRLIAETHRNGATTTYEYARAARKPHRIVEPGGAIVSIELDDLEQPVRVVDADGVVTRFEWDRDGQIAVMIDGLGNRTLFAYEPTGELRRVVDGSGVETAFDSDAAGRVVRSVVGGSASTLAYTAAGRPVGGADGAGVSWSATYGDHGRARSFTDGLGSVVRFEWDVLGNLAAVVAPDGERYEHAYDRVGRLVGAVDPEGRASARELDAEGRVVGVVDAAGRRWRRELDALGRTLVSTDPAGAATRYEYHPIGVVASVEHPDGTRTTTEVDERGRIVAIVDPDGGRFELEYTPAGRLATRRYPSGRAERFEYDAAGRRVARTTGDRVERATLDGRGRLRRLETPERIAEVAYDAAGDMSWLADGRATWTVERDAGGRVMSVVDGEGRRSTFERDGRGAVVAAADGSGLGGAFEYDERGRVAAEATTGSTTTFGYDRTGFLQSITDPTGVLARVLDPTGRVVGVERAGVPAIEVALDAAGRPSALSANGTAVASFAYDVNGSLVEAVRAATAATTVVRRDRRGSVVGVDGPAGSLSIERDADGAVAAFAADGATIDVERDAAGRVFALHDPVAGRLEIAGRPSTWSYDRSGRITGTATGATYRYDDAGRLVEALDASGRLWTFDFGADGLLAAETGPFGSRRYRRGFLGRIEEMEVEGIVTTFTYDSAGRRSTATSSDGTAMRWEWDPTGALVAVERLTVDGGVERLDVLLDGLGRPARVGDADVLWDDAISGRPLRVGSTRYLHVGSTTYVSAPGAPVVERIDDPYGGDGIDDPHIGFRGELAAWGLVWMGARVYDTTTREFLSPDPLPQVPGRPGFASVYAYGYLDPVNHLDPSGARPVSQQEFDAIREREERGRLGQAWHNITEDPWGTLAMVGVVAVGVGLMFVPGGQVVGAGILIGAGAAAIQGVVQGDFSPRMVALGGALGAIPGGNSYRAAIAFGAGQGAVQEGVTQIARGDFDPGRLALNTALGGVTGGVTRNVQLRIGGARPTVDAPAPPTSATAPATRPRFIVGTDSKPIELQPGMVVAGTEVRAPHPVKPEDATRLWDEFLGDGPHTNVNPRTGEVDPDRIFSSDGLRSIRYGNHEMGSRPTRHHYHEETYTYDANLDIWWNDNRLVRVPLQ